MYLPEVLIQKVYHMVPFLDRKKTLLLCKLTNNLYSNEIKKIKKIQSFYRNHKIDNEYLLNAGKEKYNSFTMNLNYNDWNANILYRIYLSKYPESALYRFPYFLVKKMYRNNDCERKIQLESWLENNSVPNGTINRRFVSRFFRENKITSKEILIAGW